MTDKCDKWDFDPKNQAEARIDDLVKRLRAGDICYMNRAAAELTRLRERNAELEREGAAKVLSTREAVRVLRDAWRASGRRAEKVATQNPLTNEQWRAYGAMEEAYAHANELDPEKDAMFEPCELSAAQSRIASLEATARGMREALEKARPYVNSRGVDDFVAEIDALLASSESVVKSEGEKNG